jgi:hypothetical protein
MAYEAGSGDTARVEMDALQTRARKALETADKAFKDKLLFDDLFQTQAEIFYQERADFTRTYSSGDERYEGVYSVEPMLMRRDLAQNLGAMLRPRGRDWFRAVAKPEAAMKDDDAKRWCEDATKTLRNIVYSPSANFSKAMAESDHDYVTFGNAVIAHPYNLMQTGILFKCLHLKDVAWSKNAEGKVDTLHHRLHLTLRQAAQLFGLERLPAEWKREIDQGHLETKKIVYRCTMPFDPLGYDPKERKLRGAEYMAVYAAKGVKEPGIGSGEFLTFPYTVRIWMDVSDEPYGRSPCTSVALSDGRMLNISESAMIEGLEKAVRPPLIAKKGIIQGALSLQADTVTFVSEDYDYRFGDPLTPVQSGDPRYGMEFVQFQTERLGREFFVNLLKRLPEKEMTAYEAAEWVEQYVIEAAPLFEPMEAENAMLMDSVFKRAMAKGAFGAVLPDGSIDGLPEALSEADIDFEFETPLSDALRKLKAAQFDQVLGRVTALIATQHPEAMDAIDNVDFDEALRDAMEGIAPAKWQRKKDDVDAIREQRAEAQNAAKMEAMAMEAGKMALSAKPENLRTVGDAIGGAMLEPGIGAV